MSSVESRSRATGAAVFWGIVTVGLYAALLVYQKEINDYFGLGGLYAFLPIITAFVFSFTHGNFTGNFWTALGVVAKKTKGR